MEIFKKRDFGELIGETISFLAQEFKLLALSIILFVGPIVLLNTLLAQHYGLALQMEIFDLLRSGGNIWDYVGYGPLMLMQLVGLLQSIVLFTLIATYVKLYTRHGRETFGINEIWNEFLKHIGQTLPGLFIAAIIILVGTFIFILPGIYLAVVFYILAPIIVFEQNGFAKGISRTFQLIKGNWWIAFGSFIILGIIAGIANLIISAILGKILSFTYGSLTGMAFSSVIIGLIAILVGSVTSLLPVLLYTSIIADKENPELMEKIKKISDEKDDTNIFEIKEENNQKDDNKEEDDNNRSDLMDDEEKKNRFDGDDSDVDRFKPKY